VWRCSRSTDKCRTKDVGCINYCSQLLLYECFDLYLYPVIIAWHSALYLKARGNSDARRIDKLRWNTDALPGVVRQPASTVYVSIQTVRLTGTPVTTANSRCTPIISQRRGVSTWHTCTSIGCTRVDWVVFDWRNAHKLIDVFILLCSHCLSITTQMCHDATFRHEE